MRGETPAPWGGTTLHVRDSPVTVHRRPSGSPRHRLPLTVLLIMLVLTGVGAVIGVRANLGQDRSVSAAEADCRLERCYGAAGVSGSPISRTEVADRARRWLGHTGIRYSSSDGHYGPGGWRWYRRDCSGFVSMALRLPDTNGGATTVDLAQDVIAVPARELQPYDLIGHLGPGTGGESGHVQLFLGWVGPDHTRVRVAEQGGLNKQVRWPHVAVYRWPERMADGAVLGTYRYAGIRDR